MNVAVCQFCEFNSKPCYAIAMPTCLAVYDRYGELDSKPCNRERWQSRSTLPGEAHHHDSDDGDMPAPTSPNSTPPEPATNKHIHTLTRTRHKRTFCATPHNWAIYTIERIYAIRCKREHVLEPVQMKTLIPDGRHPIRRHAHQALTFP